MFAYTLYAVESTCMYTLDAVVIELKFYVPKGIIFFRVWYLLKAE